MAKPSFVSKLPFFHWRHRSEAGQAARGKSPRRGMGRIRLGMESLEARVVPANFSEAAGVINLALNNASETVQISSNGASNYTITSSNTITGTLNADANFTGFGGTTGVFTTNLTGAGSTTQINITGALASGHVVFNDSGANPYGEIFNVTLTNASSGNIDFFGASTFNQTLTAQTNGANARVTVQTGSTLNLNGATTLTQTAAGGRVQLNGAIVTSASAGALNVNAFDLIQQGFVPGSVIETNAATTATFRLNGGAGTINVSNEPNDFAGALVFTQGGAGSVTTLSVRNAAPTAGLPTLTGLAALSTYSLKLDNSSVPLANGTNLPSSLSTFTYLTGGDVTQSGPLSFTSANFTVLGNNSIRLNTFANTIGTVSFSAVKGDNTTQVSYLGSASANIDVSSLGLGTFNISVQGGGNITQTGPIKQKIGAAGSTFTLGTGTAITLGNLGNRFEGPIAFAGPLSFVGASLLNDSLLPQFPSMPASVTDLTLNYGNAPLTLPNLSVLLPALNNLSVTAPGVFQRAQVAFKGNTTTGSTTVSGLLSVAGLAVGQTVTDLESPRHNHCRGRHPRRSRSTRQRSPRTQVSLTAATTVKVATNAASSPATIRSCSPTPTTLTTFRSTMPAPTRS